MSKYDLSIIIPAKSEIWLAQTVKDLIANKTNRTEIIVVLDGEWAEPPIADHPDVRIIYSAKNLGQRGATNLGVKLSTAKYVAKADAHTAYDEGFDVKLMEAMKGHDDWTIVPVMRNLHVFNYKCLDCGDETYQGPPPEGCKNCNVNTPDRFEKVIVWNPKPSPQSSAYKFTPNRLQFKYFGSLKNKQQQSGERVVETMSLQGSFFMLTREKYWELNICDESWGGWGQQGTEVALKTWLSGGRVVCNLDTWYAHMFRTQSGFAFPWGNSGKQQQKAREASWELFYKNQWELQTRPLSWLIERFWDTLQQEPDRDDDPKWTLEDLAKIKATEGRFGVFKSIIYYTAHQKPVKLAKRIQNQLKSVGLPIVSASLKPMDNMGTNVVVKGKPGTLTYFRQIVAALEASTSEVVFFCEDDVLYHKSHFDFTPPEKNKFYYNHNWWKVGKGDLAVSWDANQVSQLCCYRDHALNYYRGRLQEIESQGFNRSYEPGGRDKNQYEAWKSEYPNIDIRGDWNMTKSKWSPEDFRDKSTAKNFETTTLDHIEGWPDLSAILS